MPSSLRLVHNIPLSRVAVVATADITGSLHGRWVPCHRLLGQTHRWHMLHLVRQADITIRNGFWAARDQCGRNSDEKALTTHRLFILLCRRHHRRELRGLGRWCYAMRLRQFPFALQPSGRNLPAVVQAGPSNLVSWTG
jgi:hypothetical protein